MGNRPWDDRLKASASKCPRGDTLHTHTAATPTLTRQWPERSGLLTGVSRVGRAGLHSQPALGSPLPLEAPVRLSPGALTPSAAQQPRTHRFDVRGRCSVHGAQGPSGPVTQSASHSQEQPADARGSRFGPGRGRRGPASADQPVADGIGVCRFGISSVRKRGLARAGGIAGLTTGRATGRQRRVTPCPQRFRCSPDRAPVPLSLGVAVPGSAVVPPHVRQQHHWGHPCRWGKP
jgi:hypothetical protein